MFLLLDLFWFNCLDLPDIDFALHAAVVAGPGLRVDIVLVDLAQAFARI
jgi:hypothetical protein